MSTHNKQLGCPINLTGRIGKPRYDLTDLVYRTNADIVDWINSRVFYAEYFGGRNSNLIVISILAQIQIEIDSIQV